MTVPIYLVAAYLVFWALPLLLLLSIWSRQHAVERQLEDLRDRIERGTLILR